MIHGYVEPAKESVHVNGSAKVILISKAVHSGEHFSKPDNI